MQSSISCGPFNLKYKLGGAYFQQDGIIGQTSW